MSEDFKLQLDGLETKINTKLNYIIELDKLDDAFNEIKLKAANEEISDDYAFQKLNEIKNQKKKILYKLTNKDDTEVFIQNLIKNASKHNANDLIHAFLIKTETNFSNFLKADFKKLNILVIPITNDFCDYCGATVTKNNGLCLVYEKNEKKAITVCNNCFKKYKEQKERKIK